MIYSKDYFNYYCNVICLFMLCSVVVSMFFPKIWYENSLKIVELYPHGMPKPKMGAAFGKSIVLEEICGWIN